MTNWTSSVGVVRLPFFGRCGSVKSGPLTYLWFRPSWLLHESSTVVQDLPNVGAHFTAGPKSKEISTGLGNCAISGAILIAWCPLFTDFLALIQVQHHARTGSCGGFDSLASSPRWTQLLDVEIPGDSNNHENGRSLSSQNGNQRQCFKFCNEDCSSGAPP